MTEVKVGNYVPFYYFSLGTPWTLLLLLLTSLYSLTLDAYAAPTSQFANQILSGRINVFRHYIPGGRRVGRAAFSDIGQDIATSKQRLKPHCLGPGPREWADPAEETAQKIADHVSSLMEETGPIPGFLRARPA